MSESTIPLLPASSDYTPVGLFSDPIGNVATEQPGTVIFPSHAFEGADWFGLSRQVGRGIARGQAEFGTFDPESGTQIAPPEDTIDAETANKAYGIPGKLKFDASLPPSVAQSMQDAKREEIARQDAAERTPEGFWPHAARMGASFVAGALDPLNVAAAFMPTIGEARIAGILARAGVAGLGEDVLADIGLAGARAIPSMGARLAVRGTTGGLAGVTGQLPLVALRYGLSQQEQADYSGMDALGDVMMGAVLGAGMHVGAGALGDALSDRFVRSPSGLGVAADPETAEAAIRTSVAQMADGHPVEVRPVVDAAIPVLRTAADRALHIEDAVYRGGADFGNEDLNPRAAYRQAMETVPDDIRDNYLVHGIDATRAGTRTDALAEILRDRPAYLTAGPVLPANEQAATGTLATRITAPYLLVFEGRQPMADGPSMVIVNTRSADIVGKVKAAFPGEPIVSPDEAARVMRGEIPPPGRTSRTVATPSMREPGEGEAARAGDISSAFDQASRYAHGEPTPEERETADMAKAATSSIKPDKPGEVPSLVDQHIADAQEFLARADAQGILTNADRDEIEASKGWFQQAAEFSQGVAQAASCLIRGGG